MFALGTYVSCDKDCSNHALNVDQSIAITLLNKVGNDMSPMVREVIIMKDLMLFIILFDFSQTYFDHRKY